MSGDLFDYFFVIFMSLLFPVGILFGKHSERRKVKSTIIAVKLITDFQEGNPHQSYEWLEDYADETYKAIISFKKQGIT